VSPPLRSPLPRLLADPRHFQIAFLGSFLAYGLTALAFPLRPLDVLAAMGGALLAEAATSRLRGKRFDPRSPLITSLSLSLILRAASPWVYLLAGAAAIAGKALLRVRGKHLFNPAALGIAVAVLLTDRAWISPGQWGSGPTLLFLFLAAGGMVVHRALRSDVSWAFLAAYAALTLARAGWLGDPWEVPFHSLQSGALLLFAFFMISDPKTTPDARPARLLYAVLVALGAGFVHFVLHRPNGFLWSLLALAPVVPALDLLLPAARYRWAAMRARSVLRLTEKEIVMPASSRLPARASSRAALVVLLPLALGLGFAGRADAFCGFYVSKADTKLFNRASQVVLVRDGDRTVITMAADYQGDPREFALVVPVPTFLTRDQIHVGEQAVIDHLDAYTAPRLVEYHDSNPCDEYRMRKMAQESAAPPSAGMADQSRAERDLGVTVEAKYTVGEYDILILSAEESQGLETWLRRNGYRIPDGAADVLGSYLRQGMRFFVAKVNLDEQARLGVQNLRPLQMAFETPKFGLPIRLGTVNAEGTQEMFVYTLTRRGRVETTNYRTIRLPSDVEIPPFVQAKFEDFYRDLFTRQYEEAGGRGVFLEYAWDMAWCDPCAADPLSVRELRDLGVFWLDAAAESGPARDVFVTRLHVRYDKERFPEDLRLQETADRSNFQGRYVMRQAWTGSPNACPAAREYFVRLAERREREAVTLARLTGWDLEEIRSQLELPPEVEPDRPWWQRIWPARGPGR
jgi:Na+-translocating ferredoxin:NAD+ oxidoreductase RnfD subunit